MITQGRFWNHSGHFFGITPVTFLEVLQALFGSHSGHFLESLMDIFWSHSNRFGCPNPDSFCARPRPVFWPALSSLLRAYLVGGRCPCWPGLLPSASFFCLVFFVLILSPGPFGVILPVPGPARRRASGLQRLLPSRFFVWF